MDTGGWALPEQGREGLADRTASDPADSRPAEP